MSNLQTTNISAAENEIEEGELADLRREVLSLRSEVERQRRLILATQAVYPSFIKFGELPAEIQTIMWRHAYNPRVITMGWAPEGQSNRGDHLKLAFCTSRFSTVQRIPTSAVCKQSREIFKKDYEKVVPSKSYDENDRTSSAIKPIYINFDIDTLLIPGTYHYDYATASLNMDVLDGLRPLHHLAIWWRHFEHLYKDVEHPPYKSWLYNALTKLPQLEKMIVVGNEFTRYNMLYRSNITDYKLVASKNDTTFWEMIMGYFHSWDDMVKANHPALTSVRVHMADAKSITKPDDHDTHYIKMGPAEETVHRQEHLENRPSCPPRS